MDYRSKLVRDLSQEERARLASLADKLGDELDFFPLSFAQERLWFLDQLEPNSSFYNMATAIRMVGPLKVEALKKAFTEIIRRHEILRTVFPMIGPGPAQVILGAKEAKITHLDLSALPDNQRQARLHLLLDSAARDPFDLASGPLLRVALIKLGHLEHVLALALHHIICDGWSLGVLVGEVASLYDSYSQGLEPALPELPIQYADYAVWQRQRADEPLLRRQLGYWKRKLGGEKPVLELPTDRPRPPLQTYAGARQEVLVRREVAEGLRQIGRGEEATLYMALLAGFAVMMKRYSGQESVLIGTPVAGRRREEVEGLIGLFVNTVVMKVEVDESKSVREMIRAVKEEAVEAYENEEVSYEKVVEEVGVERETSRSPVVQVMMALQNAPQAEMRLKGLDLEIIDIELGTAKSDLAMELQETEEGLEGSLEYNTDLFDASAIRRMVSHFRNLLESVVEDPEQRISDLKMLSASERRQMLYEWNDTGRRETTWRAHELFQQQAKRSPEVVAVEYCRRQISYRELDERSNQLAHYLRNIGMLPGTRVGVFTERSLEMALGLIGLLKAGCVYVPLDPAYPDDRLAFIVDDSQIRALLTQDQFKERLSKYPARTVCLDSEWESIGRESRDSVISDADPSSLAYVIYTSGSTGKPKGVMVSHRAICNRLLWGQQVFPLTEADALLQITSLTFDASLVELLPPLIAGARLVVAKPGGHRDNAYLAGVIARDAITTLNLVPSLLQVLLDEPGLDTCASLRLVFSGGETLQPEVMKRCFTRLKAELYNIYGPTETTIDAVFWKADGDYDKHTLPIGRPVGNAQAYALDAQQRPVPIGVPGELYVGGICLALGYIKRPDLTAEKFIPNPFSLQPGERLYKTGDRVRYLPDGNIEFLGRLDHQVKIRGYRIETGEIEAALNQHAGVQESLVVASGDTPDEKRLVAYVVTALTDGDIKSELRGLLAEQLPAYMIPSAFVFLDSLPLTPEGKIDRRALPRPEPVRRDPVSVYEVPRSELEKKIAAIWREALRVDKVGINDNFFDLGGHSLLMIRVHAKMREAFGQSLSMVDMFKYPTIGAMARYLNKGSAESAPAEGSVARKESSETTLNGKSEIAIIGMAGRFPGAKNLQEFWQNLSGGVESIAFFSDEELLAVGVEEGLLRRADYVRAGGALDGIEMFDAGLFGYSPREADIMDPQHRFFLECSLEALENAGYGAEKYRGRTGVFAGESSNTYLLNNVYPNRRLIETVGDFQTIIGNDRDHLTTIVSYKLNLKGPSLTIQTACSTSLVAIHVACQSLLARDCDVALAGGVSINVPQETGYIFEADGVASPDGHCRAFDIRAQGTVSGNGVGIVVLKRLSDAVADRDHIHAVIKGSAINNDGSLKVGYTAPSVDGQAEVIAAAQAAASVSSDTISYVEAHGTATPLGDPIEVAALTKAFRSSPCRPRSCALGSVKTNIGHLDAAAGVAGLIKTALALKHGQIPPSLHFEQANPNIDFEGSPFYVNAELKEWEGVGGVRRAGVSSFGIGGTNAHVIVERWEGERRAGERTTGREVIVLSGRSPGTLEQMSQRVSRRLGEMREEELPDAAYTLAVGRRSYQHRKAVVCSNLRQAISALETGDPERVFERFEESTDRPVIFMFPGGGSQHVRMGLELYQTQRIFREQVDACAEILKPHLNTDLREVLYPGDKQVEEAIRRLEHPAYALPALFVTEYALAMVFNEWGVKPKAMIGHSLGEYVAACLAGVFSLKDALLMVALRGRLFRNLPEGAMLSIPLSPEDTRPFLNDQLSIAAINGPSLCLVSGPMGAIDKLQRAMTEIGADVRRLRISAAGHSKMVEPILEEFTESIAKISLRKPLSPFISNVTGDWIKLEEATNPQYWSRHLRQTVRFAQGMEELLKDEEALFLELGPGHGLSSLARQQKGWAAGRVAVTSMRHPHQEGSDEEYLLKALAQVWLSGADVDWEGVMGGRERHRVEMPAYPLERKRHWIDARYAPGSSPGDQYEDELREPERHQRPRVSASYVAPRNELEVSLVGTWEKLLGIQGVGVYDNFFELGGHSLLGTQMISRLREELEIELPLRALFMSPTVSGLAKTIVEAQAAQEDGRILSNLLKDIRRFGQDEIQALIEEERRLVKEEAND